MPYPATYTVGETEAMQRDDHSRHVPKIVCDVPSIMDCSPP
jgi:hypothetical protein